MGYQDKGLARFHHLEVTISSSLEVTILLWYVNILLIITKSTDKIKFGPDKGPKWKKIIF